MIGKFLREHILADDGTAPSPTPAAQPQAKPQPQATGTPGYTPTAPDNAYVDVLRGVIKSRTTAFTTLLAAADKLVKFVPDPNTRLQAAFASVQGEGRGLKQVLDSIAIHAADLEAQQASFAAAAERQKKSAVGVATAELSRMDEASDTARAQIQSMTTQIDQLNSLIAKNADSATDLRNKITAEETQLATNQHNFETALAIVKAELDSQKNAVTAALST